MKPWRNAESETLSSSPNSTVWPGHCLTPRRSPTSSQPDKISLSLGGSVYDPTDAVGRLLFNVLAMVAEFESDLIRLRTVEGMKVAKAKGRLRSKQPKLNPVAAVGRGLAGAKERSEHGASLGHSRALGGLGG